MFEGRFRKMRPVERRPVEKKCRRIIKRDDQGRVKEERFEGCSPAEIKMMREGSDDE